MGCQVDIPHFFARTLCNWAQCLYFYNMINYEPKILLAFGETFEEENGEEFFKWLLENGYPELAALSSCIRGSVEARDWLMKNQFTHFAALDGAIDGKEDAYAWLNKHDFQILAIFADAIHNKPEAIKWLLSNNLDMFVHLATKIRSYGGRQKFDYHKLHF